MQTSMDGNITTSTLLFTPTRQDNGKNLVCRASNDQVHNGIRESTLKLNVFCEYLKQTYSLYHTQPDSMLSTSYIIWCEMWYVLSAGCCEDQGPNIDSFFLVLRSSLVFFFHSNKIYVLIHRSSISHPSTGTELESRWYRGRRRLLFRMHHKSKPTNL